jgi:SAM-dependent methyltransferase
MNRELASAWDRHAENYQNIVAPCTGYIAQSLFLSVAGRLPPAPRILDVACGNGELTRAAVLHCLGQRSRTGTSGSVLATDFSREMVRRTELNLRGLGGEELVRCEVHDGQALDLPDGSFDAVFSAFGIFLFPDRNAGWREAARVLKKGGWLATAVWRGPEDNALARLQMEALMPALPERIRAALPRPGWLDIASSDGLSNELARSGFPHAEISVFDAVMTGPHPRATWEMMVENPLSGALISLCTADELAHVERAVLTAFESRAGGPDRPLRFEASCHFAIARRS